MIGECHGEVCNAMQSHILDCSVVQRGVEQRVPPCINDVQRAVVTHVQLLGRAMVDEHMELWMVS